MPILVKPYLGCNLKCKYCYEGEYRKTHECKTYDLDKVIDAIEKNYDPKRQKDITLHGGEPLCLPKADAERILAKSFELTQKSSVQTNGTLIDDDFIEMFRKYKTHVGISLDGDNGLSRFRFNADTETKIIETIDKMKSLGIGVSIIAVVSRSNAETDEQLSLFKEFLLKMGKRGIGGRVNPCGLNGDMSVELPPERMAEVYRQLTLFCVLNGLTWSPFSDLASKLNCGSAVCCFQGCDLYCTDSAFVILGDGTVTNCMRTNGEDICLRAESKSAIRSKVLQSVPIEYGGCKDCEYWQYCMGGCPTTAIDGDWRNRTEFCVVWKSIIQTLQMVKRLTDYKMPGGTSGSHLNQHKDNPHIDHNNTAGRM
jgi:uncharacterized protein